MTRDEIERLHELLDQATPTPWEHALNRTILGPPDEEGYQAVLYIVGNESDENASNDAALMVAAVNSLRKLLCLVEGLESGIREAKEETSEDVAFLKAKVEELHRSRAVAGTAMLRAESERDRAREALRDVRSRLLDRYIGRSELIDSLTRSSICATIEKALDPEDG